MQNIDGSFFDFAAERTQGSNHRVSIAVPPDQWGGRAILHWANELICNPGFNSTADQLLAVATVIDRIYGRSPPTSS